MMASKVRFLAIPVIARIKLIRQNLWQILRRRISLMTNRPGSSAFWLPICIGHVKGGGEGEPLNPDADGAWGDVETWWVHYRN